MAEQDVKHLLVRRVPQDTMGALTDAHCHMGNHSVGFHYAVDSTGRTHGGRSTALPAALPMCDNEHTVAVALLAPATSAQEDGLQVLLRILGNKFPAAFIQRP